MKIKDSTKPLRKFIVPMLAGFMQVTMLLPVHGAEVANLEEGRKIFNFRCYFCHGYSGNARTLASSYLNPRPMDFTATSPDTLSRQRMLDSVLNGRPNTAMPAFADVLNPLTAGQVVDFVRDEFMEKRNVNTQYHIEANGWPNHQKYAAAFPFATGKVPLDRMDSQLTQEQIAGKRLFMTSCITCHDRGRVDNEGPVWEATAVSYPRGRYTSEGVPAEVDAMSGASPFRQHDQPPLLTGLNQEEKLGEGIFQQNCAFCHGGDGTGKNWIGSFLEPHPRNLTDPTVMKGMTSSRLAQAIRDGLPGSSMPAWGSVLTAAEIQSVVRYIQRAFHPLPET